MTRLALSADLDRCTGCQSCVVACREEKNVSEGITLVRVVEVGPEGEFPDLNMYYLPVACQQCGHPACADSCSQDAITRAENGVVIVDPERCTGCGDCVDSCPYGAIALDPVEGIARKCDLCADLRALEKQPACVATCPAKALKVIDLDVELPRTTGVEAPVTSPRALHRSAGTDPSARFVLTCQEWRDRS